MNICVENMKTRVTGFLKAIKKENVKGVSRRGSEECTSALTMKWGHFEGENK